MKGVCMRLGAPRAGRLLVALACGLVLLVPRLAEACPACSGKEPGGTARIAALGAMILLPFLIAFVVVRALRSSAAEPGGEMKQ